MFQFKASDAFLRFCKRARSFRALIFCEGKDDVKVVKAVNEKLGYNIGNDVAITDCEGINNMALIIPTMTKACNNVKTEIIVMDLNNKAPKGRVEGVVNSLTVYGLTVINVKEVERFIYLIETAYDDRSLTTYLILMGNPDLPFKDAKIDDHILGILVDDGKINKNELEKYNDSKTLVKHIIEDYYRYLMSTEERHIRKHLDRICIVLEKIR